MADRTAEAIVDMPSMLGKTGVGQDLRQIMAFRAHRVGAIDAEIRIRKQVGNQLARHDGLGKFVPPFQDMRKSRSMRAVRSGPAKFAIVVAVVTIRAKNLYPHAPPLRDSVLIQHVRQQTWLRQRARSHMSNGMARSASQGKLRHYI